MRTEVVAEWGDANEATIYIRDMDFAMLMLVLLPKFGSLVSLFNRFYLIFELDLTNFQLPNLDITSARPLYTV